MGKKRRRNRNPLLQQRYSEGYEQGKKDGIAQAVSFFIDRLKDLEKVPGIGDKTMRKVKKELGEKYFK